MIKGLVEAVKLNHERNPEWRIGQTIFNVLVIMTPETASRIRGTSLDPFYRDDIGVDDIETMLRIILDEK